MIFSRKKGRFEPSKGDAENDLFSGAYRWFCGFQNHSKLRKKIRRKYNKRVRKIMKLEIYKGIYEKNKN